MKLAIMQPYFMPYIGYFQLINSVDKFIFYDDVTFIKQGWINRNQILINNQASLFSIPLSNAFVQINATYTYIGSTLFSMPTNGSITKHFGCHIMLLLMEHPHLYFQL